MKLTFNRLYTLWLLIVILILAGCNKLIDNKPSGAQLLDREVFKDSTTVNAALAGLYSGMSSGNNYVVLLSTLPGLSADELSYLGNTYEQFIGNVIATNNPDVGNLWSGAYSIIYQANAVMEGTAEGSNLSEGFKRRSIAEARFIRAFCYFYLVNLFGDVPLALGTDLEQNKMSGRIPSKDVYRQIVEDLQFVQTNLSASYSASPGSRVHASKWAATALLARTYLFLGNWKDAEIQATALIDNKSLFELEDLTSVFSPSSKEAIWQFYNTTVGYTAYAAAVTPNPQTGIPTFFLTDSLTSSIGQEIADRRRTAWTANIIYNGTKYTYPAKYRSISPGKDIEYFTLLRLAEQYLIRAEARAQLNNLEGAREDLDVIRRRAGLTEQSYPPDQASILLAVEHERRIEFNCEMGHRWLDLKRTGRINNVLSAFKAGWQPTAAWFPVPADQRARNGNLTQNPGYN